jgi:hypothetical protein
MQLKQSLFQSFTRPPDDEILVNLADTGESILALESGSAPEGLPLLPAFVTVGTCAPDTVTRLQHLCPTFSALNASAYPF